MVHKDLRFSVERFWSDFKMKRNYETLDNVIQIAVWWDLRDLEQTLDNIIRNDHLITMNQMTLNS